VCVGLFSAWGFGLDFLKNTEQYREAAVNSRNIEIVLLFALYFLDCEQWTSKIGAMVRSTTIVVVMCSAVVFFVSGGMINPYWLILLYTVGIPAWFIITKHIFYRNIIFRDYVAWLTGPLLAAGILCVIGWGYWISLSPLNEWTPELKVKIAEYEIDWPTRYSSWEEDLQNLPSVCHASDANLTDSGLCFKWNETTQEIDMLTDKCGLHCSKIYDSCFVAFVVWATPLIVGLALIFCSFICSFLKPESSSNAPRMFFKVFILLLFGLWCTASLAGAGAGIGKAFAYFMFAAMLAISMILMATFGSPSGDHGKAALENFKNKIDGKENLLKSLLLVTSTPPIMFYFFLSIINQLVRRLRLPMSAPVEKEGPGSGCLTKIASTQLSNFKTWHHAKVLTYMMYWGIGYIIMQVIMAKLTVVLLSWLIEVTEEMNLVVVTFIIIAVGLALFLLPPVPGVPIYLTGGILIPNVGKEVLGGIAAAVSYTCIVSIILKLGACTLQQKAIGEPMSGKVYIRQLVGINSVMIRTMKLVLGQPGLNVAKVAILVGGPDWPTSVLCGIMRLSWPQIMLGTLPVFFLIVPTVLAGTFVWMAGLEMCSEKDIAEGLCEYLDPSPKYDYASTLSAIFLAGAATVQSGSMVVATIYLEAAMRTRKGELDAIPIDKEVEEADKKNEVTNIIRNEVTQWHLVPFIMKANLVLGASSIMICCYLVSVIGGCFEVFQLGGGYTFSGTLGGNVFNLFLRNGVIAMSAFVASGLFLLIHMKWTNKKVQEYVDSGKPLPVPPVPEEEVGESGQDTVVGSTAGKSQIVPVDLSPTSATLEGGDTTG